MEGKMTYKSFIVNAMHEEVALMLRKVTASEIWWSISNNLLLFVKLQNVLLPTQKALDKNIFGEQSLWEHEGHRGAGQDVYQNLGALFFQILLVLSMK